MRAQFAFAVEVVLLVWPEADEVTIMATIFRAWRKLTGNDIPPALSGTLKEVVTERLARG